MKRLMVASVMVWVLIGVAAGQTVPPTNPPDAGAKLSTDIESVTADQVGPQAAALFVRLGTVVADSRRYQDMLQGASAEDSLVLQLQFDHAQDQFVSVMRNLSALVTDSMPQTALRERLVLIHQDLVPIIWSQITYLRREVDRLRAQRAHTPASGLTTLENRIRLDTRRLDRVLEFTRDHLAALDQLGQDTTAERQYFHTLLTQRADELSGRLDLGLARIAQLKSQLKTSPGEADLQQRLVAATIALDFNAASMKTVLGIMDSEGIPHADLRAQFVSVTQDLASGLTDVRVTVTLARQAWLETTAWVSAQAPAYLLRLLVVLLIFFLGWLASRLVQKAVEKSLKNTRFNISELLKRTIVSFARNVVLGVTFMVAMSQFGISLAPLLAGLGVVGLILGFALQDSLSNFAAGMMILFYRPYDVGDLVEISSVFGKVEHMSMVSTSVLTLDNQKLVVPNSKIWGDVIKNVTDQHVRRVDMVFGISYSDDIQHAEKILNDILSRCDLVLDEPEPMVRLHTLNESSVDFVVRPWVKTPDYWEAYWFVTREVKMRFDAEGVSIPFPQRDVHLYPTGGATDAADTAEA